MSELARIADLLRKEAADRAGVPAAERQEALVGILRRELDPLPVREVFEILQELRAILLGGGGDSEAARLWECVTALASRAAAAESERKPAPAAPPAATAAPGDLERLLRAVLGSHLPAGTSITPEVLERFAKVMEMIFGAVETYEEQGRMLSAEIRRGTMLAGRSGGTIADLKRGDPLRKLIAKAVLGTSDVRELTKRLRSFGSSPILVYGAHHASVKRAAESIRRLIDPAALQKEHGRAAWEAYRKIYHNELHDFDASFQKQFIEETFIAEYFKEFDKL